MRIIDALKRTAAAAILILLMASPGFGQSAQSDFQDAYIRLQQAMLRVVPPQSVIPGVRNLSRNSGAGRWILFDNWSGRT